MAFIHFYHPKTLARVTDQSANIVDVSLSFGLNGSAGGWVDIEEKDSNRAFLATLKENSHYLKVGMAIPYGAVVESARKTDNKNGNIWRVELIGGFEYLDKIDAIASHKAAVSSLVTIDGDFSGIKTFYSDSAVGILYEVMRNNRETMVARNYPAGLFDFSPLRSHIISNNSSTFARSYRLNSLETPSMKSVVSNVLDDSDMELFRISVTDDLSSEPFRFVFDVDVAYNEYEIQEAEVPGDPESGRVFEIVEEVGDVERRAFSIAKGTDLRDRSVVERVSFDGNVAYSALMSSIPQERSGAIRRWAQTSAAAAGSSNGNVVFRTHVGDVIGELELLDYVHLTSAAMGRTISGVIVEKSVDEKKMEYAVQVGPPASFNAALRLSTGDYRKAVFNPLAQAKKVSEKTAGRKENSTGWRS